MRCRSPARRDDILIVVNDNSLDSCEVGRYYAESRGLGKNNIAHIATPPLYWLSWTEFRNMMDQLIVRMRQPALLKAGAPPAPVCTNGITPNYCQAAIDHLRQYTRIRYLVMTRGVPTRSPIGGSTLWFGSETTSIDNYLGYWLMRYFPDNNSDGFSDDVVLNFSEREIAFKDGRGMRTVDPQQDGELIVGRIDGITLGSTKALIDRIMDAENTGIYGKLYGAKFSNARWWDYSTNKLVYGTSYGSTGDSWRYQLGMLGESRPECISYMNYSSGTTAGKAPQYCNVKFADGTPGVANFRTPIADDALVYFGNLQGQSSGYGNFNNILNWVRDPACTVKLCSNAADPAACRAQSTDVFKELNTACVGVGDGFIGYNYQSFPVSYMALWPTDWPGPSGGSNDNMGFPEVRSDSGFDDSYSVWFRNTDAVTGPLCYSGSDFSAPPTAPCRNQRNISLYQYIDFTAQTVNTAAPQQYTISLRYKTENITTATTLRVQFRVYEPTTNIWIDYGTPTLATLAVGSANWTQVQTTFTLDPVKHTAADLRYSRIEIRVNTGNYSGAVGLDTASMIQVGVGTELLKNTSFANGYRQVSGGDHAAMYLSRLNGVGFWGSASHHQSGGHSFSSHPQETLIYFLRGLPFGDAVWWAENMNSGLLYGDPVYSPAAVRFAYSAGNEWDYVNGMVPLSGSAVNGRNLTQVSTTYSVDYCPGKDFYACDQGGTWLPTGLNGVGGQENMSFGTWNTSTLAYGKYTLRLAVTSTYAAKGRVQTIYDYYPVTVYDPAADDDGDGLSNGQEITTHNTNPIVADTDLDGLTDGAEVNVHGTNPRSADTDSDGMSDQWETSNNTNATVDDSAVDLDSDGLTNLQELTNALDPHNPDSDGDGLLDGPEVNVYGTSASNADTDTDQLTDYEEIVTFAALGLDPLLFSDTDDDGMSDDWERARGTDPNVDDALLDSDNDGVVHILEYLRGGLPFDAGSTPALNTLHVDNSNVSGVEDGTPQYPYATVIKAVNAASAGDTLLIAPGVYNQSFFMFSKMVRLQGAAPGVVLNVTYFYQFGSRWGVISDIAINASYQMWIENTRNVTFRDSVITSANGVTLQYASKLIFENCLHRHTTAAAALTLDGTSAVSLVNNTIADFPAGISLTEAGATVNLRNTILRNTVDLAGVADGSGIRYSLIGDGQFAGSNGNITGDPLFVDAANGDYHLQTASPGIDTGDPADSYANEPEPNGCRINMGAYGNSVEAEASSDPDGDGIYGVCPLRTDLSVTNTDSPDPVLPNDNVTYAITVTNNGPSPASGVTLTDPLPSGVSLISVVSSQGACTGTTTLTCALGGLTRNASATVTLVVKATTAGTRTNTVSVSGAELDPVPGNNTASATTAVLGSCTASGKLISGSVKRSNGTAVSGVSMTLIKTTAPQCGNRLLSDSKGFYQFIKLRNGTYTVTPTKSGCSGFTPTSRTVSMTGSNKTGQNFTGACP